jgi:hypothetical protein
MQSMDAAWLCYQSLAISSPRRRISWWKPSSHCAVRCAVVREVMPLPTGPPINDHHVLAGLGELVCYRHAGHARAHHDDVGYLTTVEGWSIVEHLGAHPQRGAFFAADIHAVNSWLSATMSSSSARPPCRVCSFRRSSPRARAACARCTASPVDIFPSSLLQDLKTGRFGVHWRVLWQRHRIALVPLPGLRLGDHQPEDAKHRCKGGKSEGKPPPEQGVIGRRKGHFGICSFFGQVAHAHLHPYDR